eukprot:426495_1
MTEPDDIIAASINASNVKLNIPVKNILNDEILPPHQYKFSIDSPAPIINLPHNHIYSDADDYRGQSGTKPPIEADNKIYIDLDDCIDPDAADNPIAKQPPLSDILMNHPMFNQYIQYNSMLFIHLIKPLWQLLIKFYVIDNLPYDYLIGRSLIRCLDFELIQRDSVFVHTAVPEFYDEELGDSASEMYPLSTDTITIDRAQ